MLQSVLGLLLLAFVWAPAGWVLGVASGVLLVSLLAARYRESNSAPALLALPSYALIANVAGVAAWWETFRQKREAMWEPTRRDATAADAL